MDDEDALDEAIERWMRGRRSPTAPAGFTRAVVARVHQERWQSERYWDLGFNIAVAAGLVLVVTGVLGLMYLSGLSAVGRDALQLIGQAIATTAVQATPAAPIFYMGGLLLTAAAVGLWWFVENY